jgi:hypothetical protein
MDQGRPLVFSLHDILPSRHPPAPPASAAAMSQLSFASVSTIDPHQTQLPLIIEPQFSANESFAHALNPFDNSLPVSPTLKSKWLAAWNGWPLGA